MKARQRDVEEDVKICSNIALPSWDCESACEWLPQVPACEAAQDFLTWACRRHPGQQALHNVQWTALASCLNTTIYNCIYSFHCLRHV
jgi:hypothetical protein